MTKLTIGIVVYDDYDGVYFTLQSIRTYHKDILGRVEFVIINNNPSSAQGKAIKNLLQHITEPVIYLEYTKHNSPFLKGKIFELAETDYVLVIDSHVLLEADTIKKLLEFYDSGRDNGNLLHGPLVYDSMNFISTHFDLKVWGSHMWGIWSTDQRAFDKDSGPFEIEAMGMGLFSCRKDSWLGFNPKFRGFGGEEGYIHEKYRKNGKRVICLPFLRWVHRFERPNGPPYPLSFNDRFRNYMIGFQELGKDTQEVVNQFKDIVPINYIKEVQKELNIT